MPRIANPDAPVVKAEPDEMVTVRVLEDGDARIATGAHEYGRGDLHYEEDETFLCAKPLAEKYRKMHWVAIEGPARAAKP